MIPSSSRRLLGHLADRKGRVVLQHAEDAQVGGVQRLLRSRIHPNNLVFVRQDWEKISRVAQ